LGEALGVTAGGDVSEVMVVGQRGNEAVATNGQVSDDTLIFLCEAGEDEQTTSGQRLLQVRSNHFGQRPGGADDDGLSSAQEDAETFFFHRRMEATDDAAARVTPPGGLIIRREDGATGTTGGAEEGGLSRNYAVEIRLPLTLTLSPLAGRGESKSEAYLTNQ